jgi:hypothetical protein
MLELGQEALNPVALPLPLSWRCQDTVTEVSLPRHSITGGKQPQPSTREEVSRQGYVILAGGSDDSVYKPPFGQAPKQALDERHRQIDQHRKIGDR